MRCDQCGAEGARLYPCGWWCTQHAPAGRRGVVVPAPDPRLTLAALRGRRLTQPAREYGPAPTRARPFTREDQKTAHLVPPGSPYALCGVPAGAGRHARWVPCETRPETCCSSCDRAMSASNPKPYDRRYWWRP